MRHGIGSSSPLHEALEKIVELLERRRIPYMVMGGLSLSVWGRVRATQDVDLAVALDPGQEPDFLRAIRKQHFLPAPARAMLGHRLLVCRYLKPTRGLPLQVDLFLARGEYQQQALARAVSVRLGARSFRVIAPEDLILYKLLADRPIDHLDIQTIVQEQKGRLDRRYLIQWARSLRLSRRLSSVLKV